MSLRSGIPLLLGRLSARLPPAVDSQIWRILRLGRPQHLARLTGLTLAGTTGTMIVGGRDPRAEFLPGRFFAADPECVSLGNVSVFQLPQRLRELRAGADLTAVKLDHALIEVLMDADYLRMPEWICSSMPVPESVEKTAAGHNSLRQDLRLIRKHRLDFIESHSEADLVEFFETMYRPHGLGRHGPSAQLRSFASVRHAMKRGALLWIACEGRKVAGVVLEFTRGRMILVVLGTAGGDESLMKKGVLSAAYYFAMQYARARRCPTIDFGGTRPALSDSLLNYKRKWGAAIDRRTLNSFDTLVWWPAVTPSVEALVKTTPLVFRDRGRLSALQVETGKALPAAWTRGLDRVVPLRSGTPAQVLAG